MSSLEESVRRWVRLDNEIREKNEEMKQLREQRTEMMVSLHNHLEERNMKHATIEINNGTLKLHQVKLQTPITYKFLHQVLESYIQEGRPMDADEMLQYIKQAREYKYVNDIRRTYK